MGDITVYQATLLKATPTPPPPPPVEIQPVRATIIQPIAPSSLPQPIAPVIQTDTKPVISAGQPSEMSIYHGATTSAPAPSTPPSTVDPFYHDILHGEKEPTEPRNPTPPAPMKPTEQKKPAPPTPVKPPAHPPTGHKLGHKVTFTSVADPHVTTGNGKKFDNNVRGDIVLAKSKSGDLEVQAQNGSIPGDPGIWQTKGAVKTNGDVVKYDAASNTVYVNGKKVPFKAGEKIDLPSGGYVQMTHDRLDTGTPFNRLQVHTKQGDDVYMLNFQRKNGGHQLDIVGNISANRMSDDVTGAAGADDGDKNQANDLKTRDGRVTTDLNAFLNDWKAKPGESLFDK